MSLFFKTFIKVFAILSSISAFFILLIILPIFLSKIENEKIFVHSKGDANSLNKIAVLKLIGPILNEPYSLSDYNLFNNIRIIYTKYYTKYYTTT